MNTKQLIIVLLLLLLPMSIFSRDKDGWTDDHTPDFDYPQTVSKIAVADLDKALGKGDGNAAVGALVRYGLAESMVSPENIKPIMGKIDSTIAKLPGQEHKTLARLVRALVLKSYQQAFAMPSRQQADEAQPASDYSEWDNAQFDKEIVSTLDAVLAAKGLEKHSITAFGGVITAPDKMGKRLMPTLHDFVCAMVTEISPSSGQKDKARELWAAAHQNDPDAMAYCYAKMADTFSSEKVELFEQVKDQEAAGLVLSELSASDDYYAMFAQWLAKFPKAPYAGDVRGKLNDIEAKSAQALVKRYYTSADSIDVTLTLANVSHATLKLMRVSDSFIANNNSSTKIPADQLTLIARQEIDLQNKVPFKEITHVKFAPQGYGKYAVVVDFDKARQDNVTTGDLATVTDLAAMVVNTLDKPSRMLVVDRRTGEPVQGAQVVSNKKGVQPLTTGANGIAVLPLNSNYSTRYTPKKGDDIYSDSLNGDEIDHARGATTAQMFTDLAIYRPGETVQWSAIVYYTDAQMRHPQPSVKATATLRDANGRQVGEQVALTTDEWGRLQGKFDLPKDRMNGSWSIRLNGDGHFYATKRFEVSEYKTPTFVVEWDQDTPASFTAGQDVVMRGKVSTYTGLPMAGVDVKLELSQHEWSWWWRMANNKEGEWLADLEAVTDAQGQFQVTIPTATFKKEGGSSYWSLWRSYSLTATATNDAGESQQASHSFIIGTKREIKWTQEGFDRVRGKAVRLPLSLNSTAEGEQDLPIAVTIGNAGNERLLQCTVKASQLVADLSALPSGQYTITATLEADSTVTAHTTIVLYSPTDKVCPVDGAAMWIPKEGTTTDASNVGHVTIGTTKPKSHIYYVATGADDVVAEGWLHLAPGMHDLKIALPGDKHQDVSVMLVTVSDGELTSNTVTLTNNVKAPALKVQIESFRNLLMPGEQETWTFGFTDELGRPVKGAMMLELYDKALQSLASNTWSFAPQVVRQQVSTFGYTFTYIGLVRHNARWHATNPDRTTSELPELQLWEQEFFGGRFGRIYGFRNEMALGAGVPAPMMMAKSNRIVEESAIDLADEVVATEMNIVPAAAADQPVDLSQVALRESPVKTALWQPMLVSDDKGQLKVTFDAPNHLSTWIMQAIGYTQGMQAGSAHSELVTQKPIMAQSSLPRFVRGGDRATLNAQVQNATQQPQRYQAVIEVFDPRTDAVLESRQFSGELQPQGSATIGMECLVPDSVPFLGFRVKAGNSQCTDGEQRMLPVLTTISPVIETVPFYLEAGSPGASVTLPEQATGSRVTVEYCNNPAWYAVLALPSIHNDNYKVATSLSHSLFALEVAQGLAKDMPQIGRAIREWKQLDQDSTLVSMLEKNQDLKIGTLLASPFVNDAERQSLRMASLDNLIDEAKAAAERQRIILGLKNLQNSDGGFVWYRYPGAESSLYTTMTVLENIGELNRMGYLDPNGEVMAMAQRALQWVDKEQLRVLKEMEKKDYGDFSDYAYLATLFPGRQLPSANKKLVKKAVDAIAKQWKGSSMGAKAYAALTLERHGKHKTAAQVTESLRQFALTKPQLGTYWDNLDQNLWGRWDKVAVTTVILRALHEVDNREAEINSVRKWVLLMKQTNDWGSSSLAADAVHALLTTGTQWLQPSGNATVSLNGTPIVMDRRETQLGYGRSTIQAKAGDVVAIERTDASPAWGAIYCQWQQPMATVQAHSIEQVSITKQVLVYGEQGKLHQAATLHTGDKVRVQVTVKNDRDLDYVTITDERAACLEPVDATSGYRAADGTYFYLETKDSQSNVFWHRLGKGTHVISYDAWVTAPGTYTAGIATVQCQYAPQITAHTAGAVITVESK